MNKLLSALLTLAMVLSLSACGGGVSGSSQSGPSGSGSLSIPDTPAQDAPSESSEEPAASNEADAGPVLVAYFSATGNTESVAERLQTVLNADLYEIVPAEPYSDADLNYGDSGCRANQEQDDPGARPAISGGVENMADYQVIFLGYPIWWGIAAWPVDGFVEANDFTGKTVIPFCTSSSSGLGESGELLAELAGTGDWQEGQRFRSSVSQEDVNEWVDSLGLSAK